jgi:hypothetical protein
MHPDLEVLIQAYDASLEAAPKEAAQCQEKFQRRFQDVLSRTPGRIRLKTSFVWLIAAGLPSNTNRRPCLRRPESFCATPNFQIGCASQPAFGVLVNGTLTIDQNLDQGLSMGWHDTASDCGCTGKNHRPD